jgi:hypothetical protein
MSASGAKARGALPAIAALFVALAGSAGYLIVPMVVAALRHGGVQETLIGLIGSADPAGMFVGAGIALFGFVGRTPRRSALIALAVSLAANAASLVTHDPAILLPLRLSSGVAGGISLAVGLATLSRSKLPDRSFAQFALLQMAFGAVVAWLGDAGIGGLDIIYRCMFAVLVLGIVAALSLERRTDRIAATGTDARRPIDWPITGYTIVANFLAAASFLMLWANIQSAAAAVGLGTEQAVLVFDIGLAGGCAGALISMFIDGRGRRQLITASLFALGLVAIAAIAFSLSPWMFLAATFLLQFSTSTAFFGFGAVSDADPSGRLPIVHILAVKAGFGLAPLAASMIFQRHGLSIVLYVAFGGTLLAMLFYRKLIATADARAASRTDSIA